LEALLKGKSHTWFVTGAAGFIGSNLVETLLRHGQRIVGFDDFSTGKRENLKEVGESVGREAWSHFSLVEGSVEDEAALRSAMKGSDFVLHHAALASVPLSIKDPYATHRVNVGGFLNLLQSARELGVKRVVYASSSAVYGDEPSLPAREEKLGNLLSPYAMSKRVNEHYAQTFERCYGLSCVGLRYFNVFGPYQDPSGAYAAVIPSWMQALLRGETIFINGDGETTRDFCFVRDAVQANLRAALADLSGHSERVFNVAASHKTSLNELFAILSAAVGGEGGRPVYRDFRPGDVRHSFADITRAKKCLGYEPKVSLAQGVAQSLDWYRKHLG
jgi:UDP-N-acetylglucosamine 4-epimerase